MKYTKQVNLPTRHLHHFNAELGIIRNNKTLSHLKILTEGSLNPPLNLKYGKTWFSKSQTVNIIFSHNWDREQSISAFLSTLTDQNQCKSLTIQLGPLENHNPILLKYLEEIRFLNRLRVEFRPLKGRLRDDRPLTVFVSQRYEKLSEFYSILEQHSCGKIRKLRYVQGMIFLDKDFMLFFPFLEILRKMRNAGIGSLKNCKQEFFINLCEAGDSRRKRFSFALNQSNFVINVNFLALILRFIFWLSLLINMFTLCHGIYNKFL